MSRGSYLPCFSCSSSFSFLRRHEALHSTRPMALGNAPMSYHCCNDEQRHSGVEPRGGEMGVLLEDIAWEVEDDTAVEDETVVGCTRMDTPAVVLRSSQRLAVGSCDRESQLEFVAGCYTRWEPGPKPVGNSRDTVREERAATLVDSQTESWEQEEHAHASVAVDALVVVAGVVSCCSQPLVLAETE